MRHFTTPLLPVLLLGACQMDGTNGHPPPARSPNALAAQLQALEHRMHQRYAGASRVEEAIARSDLPRAQSEAHGISLLDEPDVLPEWRPYFASVAEAARQIEVAGDVTAAASRFATLGVRCASCHDASHARVAPPATPHPDISAGGTRMVEHQLAALAMWEGLMAPSDERWLAGAQALTTVPLTMVAQAVTPTSPQDVDDVARVRLFANRALTTGDRMGRAELFGALLGTCAHCHAVLRDR